MGSEPTIALVQVCVDPDRGNRPGKEFESVAHHHHCSDSVHAQEVDSLMEGPLADPPCALLCAPVGRLDKGGHLVGRGCLARAGGHLVGRGCLGHEISIQFSVT